MKIWTETQDTKYKSEDARNRYHIKGTGLMSDQLQEQWEHTNT